MRYSKQNYESHKSYFLNDFSYIFQFDDTYQIEIFRRKIIIDDINDLIKKHISLSKFIELTFKYELIFQKFKSTNKNEFLELYQYFNRYDLISQLRFTNNVSYGQLNNIEFKSKSRLLTGQIIFDKVNASLLNNYITDNSDDYIVFLDLKLLELYNGKYSFMDVLFDLLKSTDKINNMFPSKFKSVNNINLVDDANFFIINSYSIPPISIFLKPNFSIDDLLYEKIKSRLWNDGDLWLSYDLNLFSFYLNDKNNFIYFLENIIHNIFTYFVFSFQDDFRVSKGLPRIGEGWVSETELYYKIKEHFNEFLVLQHGKPIWLGRQHVDIWIPDFKVGIEFHGLQHDEPVAFFGGEDAFIKSKERDNRKRGLFKENGCLLIEVRKGYDFNNIILQINNFM